MVLLFILAVFAVAFFSRMPGYNVSDSQDEKLDAMYRNAMKDAEVAEESEIFRNLTRITGSNSALLFDGEGRVQVVTWTGWDGYFNKTDLNLSSEVWVTVVPEIRTRIMEDSGRVSNLTLRLAQLLGMPKNRVKKWFVELWVKPSDIFRPCPDPEITDRECQLDFPQNVSTEHVMWFNSLRNASYADENGCCPWTRLGYTYDWGGESEIGLSEFVVRNGAKVRVGAIYTTDDYFK